MEKVKAGFMDSKKLLEEMQNAEPVMVIGGARRGGKQYAMQKLQREGERMEDWAEVIKSFLASAVGAVGIGAMFGLAAGSALGVLYLLMKLAERLVAVLIGVW